MNNLNKKDVTQCEVLSRHMASINEENHAKPQSSVVAVNIPVH